MTPDQLYELQMQAWMCPACASVCVDEDPDDHTAGERVALRCGQCSLDYIVVMRGDWRSGLLE